MTRIVARVDFLHGRNEDGSTRRWEAGKPYDVDEATAAHFRAAGWIVAEGGEHKAASSRFHVEHPTAVFHPPKKD